MEKVSREQIELLIELQEIEIKARKIEVGLSKLPAKLEEMDLVLKDI